MAPIAALLIVACTGLGPQSAGRPAAPSPRPSASPSTSPAATPTATAAATPTPAAVPGAATIHCDTVPSPSALLVLGRISGSTDTVIRDLTDPANVRTDCNIANAVQLRFISATKIAYTSLSGAAAGPTKLLVADLTTGGSTVVLTSPGGTFGAGTFAFSADGNNLSYTSTDAAGALAWHLTRSGTDQVLATYPAVPGRGVDPDNDDFFLGFSPDGRFVALVQTFTRGSTSDTMALEVRSVSDGSVAFGVDDATMATWLGTGSTLLYRTRAGAAYKWPGMFPLQINPALKWIRPRPSPDGRYVVFSIRAAFDIASVYTLDLTTNSVRKVSPDGRDGPAFLSAALLWYFGERVCGPADQCGLGPAFVRTGTTYVNDVPGGNESESRLTEVFDIWPHLASGRGT